MSLPVFSLNITCIKCGYIRPAEHKPQILWCPGRLAVGMPLANMPQSATVCRFGDTEHLHVGCLSCRYEWAMEVAGLEAPLTSDEVRFVRAAVQASHEEGE